MGRGSSAAAGGVAHTVAAVPVVPAVLMPVKRFSAAKGRTASVLDAGQRADLARWLASTVVAAARPLPVFVACDDEAVAQWASDADADVLWSPGLGLNGAVDAGRVTLAGKGFDHLVVAHSDLPLATDLRPLVVERTVCLVPDRRRDGTNVMALPIDADIAASYGAGSFHRHLDQAMGQGMRVQVRADPLLALDVDTPDDLRHPNLAGLLPGWLQAAIGSDRR